MCKRFLQRSKNLCSRVSPSINFFKPLESGFRAFRRIGN